MKIKRIIIPILIILVLVFLIIHVTKLYYKPASQVEQNRPHLTYLLRKRSSDLGVVSTFNETRLSNALIEKTGINVEFLHPTMTNQHDYLTLLTMTGKIPDIIEMNNFSGGPEQALNDGIILPLNDIINLYSPNLKGYLKDHPKIAKSLRTDAGRYYAYPFIRDDEILYVSMGPIVRKDWLDRCSLNVPETIDEWEIMLRAFKNEIGATAPLTIGFETINSCSAFIGAYNTRMTYYIDDGTVKFGPLEPGFFQFIKLFSRWYKEGLLDPMFASCTLDSISTNMLQSKSGATAFQAGNGIGRWMQNSSNQDGYNLVAAPYPVLSKGDNAMFGQYNSSRGAASISTACTDVPAAAKFLDFGYSPEGIMLYNYGIEGESYTIVDGKPVYTDIIMNNSKYSTTVAMNMYLRANDNGPFLQQKDYIMQYYSLPQQKEAMSIWSATNAENHIMPEITFISDEVRMVSDIVDPLNTYVVQMSTKFILGVEPLENYDKFIQTLYDMHVEDSLNLYQAAYERYLDR